MFGLILLYFIWKNYAELAATYGKNKIGYALLGIASYYGGTIIVGVILGIIAAVWNDGLVDEGNDIFLSLIALPFGILTVWGVYKILEKRWRAAADGGDPMDSNSLDADLFKSNSD
jgi:hypothetical protein